MRGNNAKRILADVVSVDAWHTPFKAGLASIHIDAVFQEARIGGTADAPVRFRLSLRRAEVVVVVPSSEPLIVQKESVSRDQPLVRSLRVTERTERSYEGQVGGAAAAKFPVAATLGIKAKASAGYNSTVTAESDHQVEMFDITQSKTVDGFYRWSCIPSMGTKLMGRPWGPKESQRLSVRDTRESESHLHGSMRVEIRCRREDLVIDDITIKNDKLLAKLQGSSLLRNELAAVEAYLVHLLMEERLSFNSISDPFGELRIADVVVEESNT